MPRYIKKNGKRVSNVKIEYAWVEVPIKTETTETYLVQTRIADYIVLLESKIKGELPKLSPKKTKK